MSLEKKTKTTIILPKWELDLLDHLQIIAELEKRPLNNLIVLWLSERKREYIKHLPGGKLPLRPNELPF